jgi:hypothetical protein
MRPAPDAAAVRGEHRLTLAWVILLAVTVCAGLVIPPVGALVALVGAVRAHAERRPGLRAAFAVLAVLFAVLTALVGVVLVSVGGGSSATGG